MKNVGIEHEGIVLTIAAESYEYWQDDAAFMYMLEKYAAQEVNLNRSREECHFLMKASNISKRIEQLTFRLTEIMEIKEEEYRLTLYSEQPSEVIVAIAQEKNLDIVQHFFGPEDYPEEEIIGEEGTEDTNIPLSEESDDSDEEFMLLFHELINTTKNMLKITDNNLDNLNEDIL